MEWFVFRGLEFRHRLNRLDAFGIAKNHGWNCYEKDNEKS